eukprot:472455-Alexandrium_andersonii.AAC.1
MKGKGLPAPCCAAPAHVDAWARSTCQSAHASSVGARIVRPCARRAPGAPAHGDSARTPLYTRASA